MMETFPAAAWPTRSALGRDIELIRITARRALLARYRGTAFGILWAFGNPVMMTVLYSALFGTAFQDYYGSTVRYMLAAFTGVLVVTFFLQATADGLASIVANGGLLNKIAIRPIVFPLASVLANAFQQAVTTVPVLLVLSIVVARDPLRILLLPFVLIAVFALTTGVSLLLATLFVFFRDLPHLWAIVGFMLWMTSPVFYPAELVPPAIRPWLALNPLGQAVSAVRDLVLGAGPIHGAPILMTCVSGVVALALGFAVLVWRETQFLDLL